MTQKEKLYFEYLTIQNSIYAVTGNEDKQINLDEFCKTGRFCVEARNSKVFELQQDIENAKRSLERHKYEARRDAWFATEEGSRYKQDAETRINVLRERMQAAYKTAFEYTRNEVRKLLGAHVDVINFSNTSMVIGIVKKYDEDGNADAHFGHTFEVYFGKDMFKPYRWELDYGTMGGFNLDEDVLRTQFLVALSTFAANKNAVPALRDYLHQFAAQQADMSRQLYKLSDTLHNPVLPNE